MNSGIDRSSNESFPFTMIYSTGHQSFSYVTVDFNENGRLDITVPDNREVYVQEFVTDTFMFTFLSYHFLFN